MPRKHVVFSGHVDHGKSSLIGRLLFDTGFVPDSIYLPLWETAQAKGEPVELAYILDAFHEERERGVTIDVTHRYFVYGGQEFVIIDAPGHKEFISNMVTGASWADTAVLVVDVERGVEDQTRRHVAVLGLLGIKQVILAINKMDVLDYKKKPRFIEARNLATKAIKKAGMEVHAFIPVSAIEGENVVEKSEKMAWFEGQSLVQSLVGLASPTAETPGAETPGADPRLAIHINLRGEMLGARVEAGTVKPGMQLWDEIGGKPYVVESVRKWTETGLSNKEATQGECTAVTFKEKENPEPGVILQGGKESAIKGNRLMATIFWLNEEPANELVTYQLCLSTQRTYAQLWKGRVFDAATMEEKQGLIMHSDVAEVDIHLSDPIVAELFLKVPTLGRFVLTRGVDVVAAGVVKGP